MFHRKLLHLDFLKVMGRPKGPNPSLSAAEKQRRYRARRDADPERRERYLETEREKYKKDLKSGKRNCITDLGEREKYKRRRKWRETYHRLKARKEALQLVTIPPHSLPHFIIKVEDSSEPLRDFLQWCDRVGLVLSSKVYVSKEGTVADYGMIAKDNVDEGEVLFTIPRSALLHQGTTKVSALLEKEKLSLESSSGWVPLLLSLLYEYTSSESHWKPYLSLWSDFKELDHPMFWSKEERDRLLRGTGIPEAVDTDLSNIQQEYTDIVLPFMMRHPDLWNPNTHTLELYTQLVAFVMAYSFQEPQAEEEEEEDEEDDEEEEEEEKAPNPPMMVPMADMLNHVSSHNANLEFTPDSLKMVSVRCIHKGEEVFNTYGQMANWQLLHMYGFTEPYPSNSNDTADIPIASLLKAARQDSDEQLVEERLDMLSQMMQEKGAFIFNEQGCLTELELHTALKVLCMSKEELTDFKDNEGWEEDEEEHENMSQALSNEGLPELKASWKKLIHEAARLTLRAYRDGEVEEKVVDSDRVLMEDKALLKGLTYKQWRALQVRFGQKMILYRLMELTKS